MRPQDDNPYAAPGSEPPVLAQPVKESESVLRVDFHLSVEDLVEFNFYHVNHSRSMRRRLWLARGLFLVAIALALGPLQLTGWRDSGPLLLLAGVVGVGVFWYLTSAGRRKANLRRVLEAMFREGRNENLFGLHRVWISPAGVRRISRYADATFQWPAIEKIVATPQAAYIYDSAASAIVVPYAAFASEGEFRQFFDTATQFWRRATGSVDSSAAPS